MATEQIIKCDLCGHSSLEKRHWSDTIEKVELSFKNHAGLQCIPFSGDCCTKCGAKLGDAIRKCIESIKAAAQENKEESQAQQPTGRSMP